MVILIVLLGISISFIIGTSLENGYLKMELELKEDKGLALRSNFVKYEVKGLKTVYLNALIQCKGKDYEILKDGILFKDLLYVDDEIYTNLGKLIEIR